MKDGDFFSKIKRLLLNVTKLHRHVFENPGYKDYKGLYPALRQGKPVLLTGLSGTGKGAWIHQQHEPERELLGQCADGKLLGEVKTGMVKRTAFPYPGGSQERGI